MELINNYTILILIALIVSSIGFKKYVWFISLGYGFSISAIGTALLIIFKNNLNPITALSCILLIIYGLRLGGYLSLRELKSKTYNAKMKQEIKDGKTMTFIAKLSIWISCSLLYTMQASPILFRLQNITTSTEIDTFAPLGAILMIFGLILESLADYQKSQSKKKNPNRFCDTGLYQVVRCPNYLGEIIFWTGVFVNGASVLITPLQWISALIGYLCILYIMFGGARRLELRQNRTYGEGTEYAEEYKVYTTTTPIIIPLIPLYSVAKHKWLVG